MVKAGLLEPQCPTCKAHSAATAVESRDGPTRRERPAPGTRSGQGGRLERPQGHERGTYSGLNVSDARNAGSPKGGDPQGDGGSVVVGGRESRPQGEGGQAGRGSSCEGRCDAESRHGKPRSTGEPDA